MNGSLKSLRIQTTSLNWTVCAILENGFWSCKERNYFRSEAEALGANAVLHYLEVDLDELWSRVSKRNADLPPDTFHGSRENLEEWVESFEPPTEDN